MPRNTPIFEDFVLSHLNKKAFAAVCDAIGALKLQVRKTFLDGVPGLQDIELGDGIRLWEFLEGEIFSAIRDDLYRFILIDHIVRSEKLQSVYVGGDDERLIKSARCYCTLTGTELSFKQPAIMIGVKQRILFPLQRFLMRPMENRILRTAKVLLGIGKDANYKYLKNRISSNDVRGALDRRILLCYAYSTEYTRLANLINHAKFPAGSFFAISTQDFKNTCAQLPQRDCGDERNATLIESDVLHDLIPDGLYDIRLWKTAFKINDFSVYPVFASRIQKIISRKNLLAYLRVIQNVKHALRLLNPRFIITTDHESHVSRILNYVSDTVRIPNYKIPHYSDQFNDMCTLESGAHAGNTIVMGAPVNAALESSRGVIENVHLGGYPHFDSAWNAFLKMSTAKNIKYPGHERLTLLYTAQAFKEDIPVLKALKRIAANHPEYSVRIKPHPASSVFFYRTYIALSGQNNFILEKGALFPLIGGSDLIITLSSVTGVEAIICDKPVIILASFHEAFNIVAEYGAACLVRHFDELETAIRNIQSVDAQTSLSEGRKRFLRDYFPNYANESRSSADMIAELLPGVSR